MRTVASVLMGGTKHITAERRGRVLCVDLSLASGRLTWVLAVPGDREAMRTVASILMGGSEQLMAERAGSPEGAAKETAVLAALRLLRAAFDRDQAAVALLRQSEVSGATLVRLQSEPLLIRCWNVGHPKQYRPL